MPKRITISDEEYFKILELKVKYKTDSLFDVLSLVTNNQNVIIDKMASSDKLLNNQSDIPDNQNVKLDIEPKRQIAKKDIEPLNLETIKPKEPNTPLSYCDICGQESNNLKSVNYEDNDVLACELCLSDTDIKPYIKIIEKQNTNSERSFDTKNQKNQKG